MGAIREGRTAVIAVTNGWVLYRPNEALTKTPSRSRHGQDRRSGSRHAATGRCRRQRHARWRDVRPAARSAIGPSATRTRWTWRWPTTGGASRICSARRIAPTSASIRSIRADCGVVRLAAVECRERRRRRGGDRAMRKRRTESLQLLALNTDGLALLDSNDLRKQIRRAADDLTSYYLMAYYSTNSKLDGRFRSIKVRSKRPGIEIRARRGYSAATPAEVAARAHRGRRRGARGEGRGHPRARHDRERRARGRTQDRRARPAIRWCLHRGPSTGNQVQPADGRVFPRSERIRLEIEAAAGAPVWTGAVLDRNGTKTVVPVVTGERTDAATGQRWLTADITLGAARAGRLRRRAVDGEGQRDAEVAGRHSRHAVVEDPRLPVMPVRRVIVVSLRSSLALRRRRRRRNRRRRSSRNSRRRVSASRPISSASTPMRRRTACRCTT